MRRLASLLLAALSLGGCGGDGGAEDVLEQTADNLEQIESGVISMRLLVTPKGDGSERVGFELRGPFSLEGPGDLPLARVEYTHVGGSERAMVTVVSTGHKAYVEVGGQAYELPPEQIAQLRAARRKLAEGEGRGELAVNDWSDEPELSNGGSVGDAETDRIEARLDVAAAAQDLVEFSRGFGQGALGELSFADEQALARATRSATLELLTGKEDRLLRRLEIAVDLGFDVPSGLSDALGTVVGARVDFELGIGDPNEPVRISEPDEALPYSELPG
jgi:hypothetical protein